jgi:hypothetical protein
MNSDTCLPAGEIVLSALHGQLPAGEYEAVVEHVLRVAQARLAAGWTDTTATTTVVAVPASDIMNAGSVVSSLEALARIGRAVGVRIRLFDVVPPLPGTDPPLPPISVCCTEAMRQYVIDPAVDHVSYHQLTASEMIAMAESHRVGAA